MVLDWLMVGAEFMLDVRATLTPLETMPPAALTMFSAFAFCMALSASATV